MAATSVTLTPNGYPQGVDTTQRRLFLYGKAVIGASPLTYTEGGIALSWVGALAQAGASISQTAPLRATFESVSGSGYVYKFNLASNTLQIFVVEAAALSTQYPLTELTSGAEIPAGVSGDTVNFKAEFLKNL